MFLCVLVSQWLLIFFLSGYKIFKKKRRAKLYIGYKIRLMFRGLSTAALVEMIQASQKETHQAIQQMIRKNEDRVLRYVLAKGGSKEDAEDVLQEGLTDLILNVRNGKFNMDSSIHTYLIGICKFKWSNKFRKLKRANEYEAEQLTSMETHKSSEAGISFEAMDELTYWLDQLKEGCKKVLIFWAQGYSMKEISAMMGYQSAQVATNKKSGCMKALHELIAKRA